MSQLRRQAGGGLYGRTACSGHSGGQRQHQGLHQGETAEGERRAEEERAGGSERGSTKTLKLYLYAPFQAL